MVKLVSIVKNDPAKKETTYLADDGNEYTLKGDLSQRANNPGNISPTGSKARGIYEGDYGAIGYLPSSNGPPVAVFPDMGSGVAAQQYLWSTPNYQNKTLKAAAASWAEKSYAGTLAGAAGVTADTKVSDLTQPQMSAIMAAQMMAEGRGNLSITDQSGNKIPVLSFRGEFSAPQSSNSGGSYTIKKGDTLSNIAARTGTSVAELAKANGISDPNRIYAGSTLTIPGQGGAFNPGSSGVDTSSLAGVLKASAPRSLMSPSSSGVDTSSLAGILKASGTTPTAAKQPESASDLINRNYLGMADVLNSKFGAGIVYEPSYDVWKGYPESKNQTAPTSVPSSLFPAVSPGAYSGVDTSSLSGVNEISGPAPRSMPSLASLIPANLSNAGTGQQAADRASALASLRRQLPNVTSDTAARDTAPFSALSPPQSGESVADAPYPAQNRPPQVFPDITSTSVARDTEPYASLFQTPSSSSADTTYPVPNRMPSVNQKVTVPGYDRAASVAMPAGVVPASIKPVSFNVSQPTPAPSPPPAVSPGAYSGFDTSSLGGIAKASGMSLDELMGKQTPSVHGKVVAAPPPVSLPTLPKQVSNAPYPAQNRPPPAFVAPEVIVKDAPYPAPKIDRPGIMDFGGTKLPGVAGFIQNVMHAAANSQGQSIGPNGEIRPGGLLGSQNDQIGFLNPSNWTGNGVQNRQQTPDIYNRLMASPAVGYRSDGEVRNAASAVASGRMTENQARSMLSAGAPF